MRDCADTIRLIETQFGTSGSEFRAGLSGRDDGDREDGGSAEKFLSRGYDASVLVDCWAEFLLDVADAGWCGSVKFWEKVGT